MLSSENHGLRLGMITPSSNSCLEPTTYRLLAGTEGVSAHFARIAVTRIALDQQSDAQFSAESMTAAATSLAHAHVDAVVWNGTSGSWLGIEHDQTIAEQLQKLTGVPATTSTLALLDACAAYGVTRLGLVTPYLAEVNEAIVGRYAAAGIEIVAEDHLGLGDNDAFARATRAAVAEQVRATSSDAHAVAIACTNVHGAELVPDLERELGIPVFDSVTASLWAALRLAGHPASLTGWGTLLQDGALRAALQSVTQTLLEHTAADRTTLRLDLPSHGLGVDVTAAESLRAGTRSIRRDSGLDQRRLNTVQWVEEHRQNLVQPDFSCDPTPPPALIDVYGVRAQMLGPVQVDPQQVDPQQVDSAMTGWLSAHSLTERPWTGADLAAMDRARADVERLLRTA